MAVDVNDHIGFIETMLDVDEDDKDDDDDEEYKSDK